MKRFKILTVGWKPDFAHELLTPIQELTDIEFTHGIVGDAASLPIVQREYPDCSWVALSKSGAEELPDPDCDLLGSLECAGVPTLRSMARGDQVLRGRPESEALGYATMLARRIDETIATLGPDVVLASFDSLHSAMALAVAKKRGVPWVALAFSVIPEHLTAFARGMTPDVLVPIERSVDESLRQRARDVIEGYRSNSVRIMAYRPPQSISARARQMTDYSRGLFRRLSSSTRLGVDRYVFPSAMERFTDIARRTLNRLRIPDERMVKQPPDGPFVFFPLHMAPESSVDTWAPMYQNQLELAFQLSLAVPVDLEVVVKLHFSDPDNYSPAQLARLLSLPRVRIAHPGASARTFIERSSLVVGIQGTASLEAALIGKPVLLFGDSPYQHFPRSERALRPDRIHAQIRRMRAMPAPADGEIVEAFAKYMSRYMEGRINDWGAPLLPEEQTRLANCFRELKRYLETAGTRETWYDHAPFKDQGFR